MALKIFEIICIIISTIVGGMYWGPWLALSRSLKNLNPEVFLAIVNRLKQNMELLMTILTPLGLLSTLPVLFLSFNENAQIFYMTLLGLVFFIIALLTTLIIEVPIVMQIVTWTVLTLPDDWQALRDRWGKISYYKSYCRCSWTFFYSNRSSFIETEVELTN